MSTKHLFSRIPLFSTMLVCMLIMVAGASSADAYTPFDGDTMSDHVLTLKTVDSGASVSADSGQTITFDSLLVFDKEGIKHPLSLDGAIVDLSVHESILAALDSKLTSHFLVNSLSIKNAYPSFDVGWRSTISC